MDSYENLPRSLLDIMRDPKEQALYTDFRNGEPHNQLLARKVKWDKELDQWVEEAAYNDLENAIKQAQAFGIGVDIDVTNCSWQQVRSARSALADAMRRAKESYSTKGAKSIPRRLLRKGSIINQVLAPFVNLIPDEKGINVLRAGLSILFVALERRESNREKIFEAFEDIGDILEDAERVADPTDNVYGTAISEAAVELYSKALQEVPKLLLIIDPKLISGRGHNFKRWTVSHLLPGLDAKAIPEIIDNITRPYKKLEHRIESLCHEKLLKLGERGVQLMKTEAKILQTSQATHEIVSNISLTMNSLVHKAAEMEQKLDELKSDISRTTGSSHGISQLQDMKSIAGDAWNGLYLVVPNWDLVAINDLFQNVCDNRRTRDYYNTVHSWEGGPPPLLLFSSASTGLSPTPRPQGPTVSDILRAINAPNPLILNQDLLTVFSDGTTMEEEVLKRARWLLSIQRFKSWLISPQSDYLYVDGDCTSALSPRSSGFSVVDASLLATLRELNGPRRRTIALGFFCGQYCQRVDEYESDSHLTSHSTAGPLDILRSLIAQLITYPGTPDWKFSAGGWYRQLDILGTNEPEAAMAMIRILQALIVQLPPNTTVYIIIDGLCELEDSLHDGWDETLDQVALGLITVSSSLARSSEEPSIKSLFTCAPRRTVLERVVRMGDDFDDYGQNNHHIGLWAGMADSRAGVASEFGADFLNLFGGPSEYEDDYT